MTNFRKFNIFSYTLRSTLTSSTDIQRSHQTFSKLFHSLPIPTMLCCARCRCDSFSTIARRPCAEPSRSVATGDPSLVVGLRPGNGAEKSQHHIHHHFGWDFPTFRTCQKAETQKEANLVFQPSIFRCYLSVREGSPPRLRKLFWRAPEVVMIILTIKINNAVYNSDEKEKEEEEEKEKKKMKMMIIFIIMIMTTMTKIVLTVMMLQTLMTILMKILMERIGKQRNDNKNNSQWQQGWFSFPSKLIWYWHILTDFKGVERPKFGDLKIPGNGWCSNDLFSGDLGPHPFLAWLNRSWCILASLRWPSSCTLSALTKKSCVRMSSVNLYNYSSFPKKNISWKTVCPIKNTDFLWLLPILYIKIQTEITKRLQPHLVLENLMMSATQRGPGSDGQGGRQSSEACGFVVWESEANGALKIQLLGRGGWW